MLVKIEKSENERKIKEGHRLPFQSCGAEDHGETPREIQPRSRACHLLDKKSKNTSVDNCKHEG